MRFISRLKNKSIGDIIEYGCQQFIDKRVSNRNIAKRYKFSNKSNGYENLLLILAGFQPYYWDKLMARVNDVILEQTIPLDVCICIPGGVKMLIHSC